MKCSYMPLALMIILLFSTKAQAEEILQMESMTVTANKKSEDLQTVASSITVLRDLDLEDKKIQSITDLAAFTPNFHNFDTGIMGLYTPSIRGKAGESSGSSVGLYVDGIPILTGSGFNDALLDIERVEILRGPQATLYGKNTQAGAINIISKTPGNKFAGKVTGSAGENKAYRLTATLNVPIVEEKVALRISGLHDERDGYLTYAQSGNNVDYRDYNYGKLHVLATPTEAFTMNFIACSLAHDDGGLNMNITDRYAQMFGLPPIDLDKVQSNKEGWNDSSSNMQVLKLGWEISPSWIIESVSSHRKYENHYLNDWDFTRMDFMHKEMDWSYLTYAQEIRAHYTANQLNTITGIYGEHSEDEFTEINDIARLVDEEHSTENDSLGLFVDVDFNINQQITLSSGLRYDRDKGKYNEPSRLRNITETWGGISPKFAISYKPSKEIMTYLSTSKGYLSGGFNDHAAPDNPTSFDQEALWSYELGIKSKLLHNRILFNAALFYMDIDDYQVRIDVSPEYNYTDNAAKAESYGFEAEAQARVTQSLTVNAGIGYTHAEFKEYRDATGDYSGKKLPYAPESSLSLGGIYRHAGGLYTSINLTGYGKMYLNKDNQHPRDSYVLVNAKAGYETKNFDIYLYADNLFDKDHSANGYFGGLYRVASPPRQIGVSLTYRF